MIRLDWRARLKRKENALEQLGLKDKNEMIAIC
jgi:hypothetical protein